MPKEERGTMHALPSLGTWPLSVCSFQPDPSAQAFPAVTQSGFPALHKHYCFSQLGSRLPNQPGHPPEGAPLPPSHYSHLYPSSTYYALQSKCGALSCSQHQAQCLTPSGSSINVRYRKDKSTKSCGSAMFSNQQEWSQALGLNGEANILL